MASEEIGGRYAVIERIGKGAMGVVYKAHDPVLDRVVAIKKMASEIGQDEELRQRFYVEARAAARLNHRNIVTIHELEEADGEIYIVMELLEGLDLASVIRRRVPLPLEARLGIVAQLCEGLDYAHRHGIVHRDIKPGNLHLGPSGVVKILDFGIARIASSKMTGTGALLGTPDYMSPEQVLGESIDPRSDLFAVGGVLYELLASAKPFESDSVASLLIKIAKSPHIPITDRVPDLPVALVSLVNRLLAKDRELRPATAGAVLAEVRGCIQSSTGGSDAGAAAIIGGVVTEQTMAMGSGTTPTLPPPSTPRPGTPRPVGSSVPHDWRPAPAPTAPPPESTTGLSGAPASEAAATVLRPRGSPPPPAAAPNPASAIAAPVAEATRATKRRSGAVLAFAAALLIIAGGGGGTYYLLVVRQQPKPADSPASTAASPASSSPPSSVTASQAPPSPTTSTPEAPSAAPTSTTPAAPFVADTTAATPTSLAPAIPAPAPTPSPVAPAVDPEQVKAEAARDRLANLRQARARENAPALPIRARNDANRLERQGILSFDRGEYARAAVLFEEAGRVIARERPGRGNAANVPPPAASRAAAASGGRAAPASKPVESPGAAPPPPPPDRTAEPPPTRAPSMPREGTGDISAFQRAAPPSAVDQMFNASPSARATIARITDLIERYARAMEQRNLGALRVIRTGLNPQEERIVSGRQISYKLDDLNVQLGGPEATATARRTVTGEVDSGARLNIAGPVSIRLVRRPTGWVITEIR